MKKITLFSLVSLLLLGACTLEKRVYRNGYNVQWHSSLKVKNQQPEQVTTEEISAVSTKAQKSMEADNSAKETRSTDAQIATHPLQGYKVNTSTQELVVNETSSETQQLRAVVKQYFVKESSSKATHTTVKAASKKAQRLVHVLKKTSDSSSDDVPMLLIYLLCFFLPPVAVGLVTDWDTEIVIYNLLWTILCGFPGIIHALIIVGRYK
jgi:uncharacterized membrane protein YqaE (UPF0057 family)/outer membrane murein-binding lipoprotein Lpp